jgi:hypothetical protein
MFPSTWCVQPMTRSALRRSFLGSCGSTEEDEAWEDGEVCAFLRDEEGDLDDEERKREVDDGDGDLNREAGNGDKIEVEEGVWLTRDGGRLGKVVALIQDVATARLSRMPTFIVPPSMSVEDVTLAAVALGGVAPAEKMKREEGEGCQDRAGSLKDAAERASQQREGVVSGVPKQHVGCAPSKEAMGYTQRALVGLEFCRVRVVWVQDVLGASWDVPFIVPWNCCWD